MRHLILIALLFIATLNAIENKKITLQLSWLNQFQFAGYYIAIEKGYYKEVGIDLTIKEFSNDTNLIKDIENKKVDFAIGRSSLIIDKSEGKDIVALAAIFQKSPLMLLTLKRDDIKQLSDLKHKNIMITSDAKSTASIMAMLNSKNILKDDINIQKHTFNLDDLINGKADAMASYVSNEPIKLKDKDIKYQIFHPKDYSFDLYSDILFTSSSFIKSNPKLTKDFYEASMKGWRYAFENIVESAQIIHTKYNTQNKTLLSYIKEGEILKDLVYHQGSQEIGCLDEDKLTKIVNIYKVMGFIKNDFDIKQFIYKHNTHKKIKFELAHKEIYLVLILSILL
ncbi:MAG: ABC transporter substrate-binding protein, partial [Campylobacterota bacterium]|nr:ABC transporter substrate-binding protein [Campylobacterota bacterium]